MQKSAGLHQHRARGCQNIGVSPATTDFEVVPCRLDVAGLAWPTATANSPDMKALPAACWDGKTGAEKVWAVELAVAEAEAAPVHGTTLPKESANCTDMECIESVVEESGKLNPVTAV